MVLGLSFESENQMLYHQKAKDKFVNRDQLVTWSSSAAAQQADQRESGKEMACNMAYHTHRIVVTMMKKQFPLMAAQWDGIDSASLSYQ